MLVFLLPLSRAWKTERETERRGNFKNGGGNERERERGQRGVCGD